MPSAPLSASSQPRVPTKTNTPKAKSRPEADKENKPDASSTSQENAIVADVADPGLPHAEVLPPSTPAVRIELEDLIGNTEDIFNRPPPVGTPGDHVHWHNGPNSSDVASAAHTTQRSRKRARSSSPASSQLERSANVGPQDDATRGNRSQKSLRTPEHDPTQDLWRRYMNANGSRCAEDESLLSLARLPPSSPTTPSSGTKDGVLRRTVSCGVEWPTSKSKRRKIDVGDSLNRTKNIFAASRRDILAREVSKTSRVSLLVEKIQESLARQARAADEPSSSSPLPGKHSQMPLSQGSPLRSPTKQRDTRKQSAPHSSAPAGLDMDVETGDAMLDDFDDDGLDLDFFEQVEKGMSQVAVSQNPATIVRDFADSQHARRLQTAQPLQREHHNMAEIVPRSKSPNTAHKETSDNSFDIFDDDDDDMFTTEMESLVAQVDSHGKGNATAADRAPDPVMQKLPTIPELDGSFDDGDDDNLLLQIADDVDQGKTGIGPISQKFNNRAIKRYLIIDVFLRQYETPNGKTRPEKMLSVTDERTEHRYIILLRQSWYDTRCTKGSYVHIIGTFDHFGQCIVDDAENMIILHPDHLISATVVSDSFTCTRRAALQDRVKSTSRATAPMVYGHIIHELFGEALRRNKWDRETFAAIIQKLLPSYLESLYEIGVTVADAREYLLGKTPELTGWAHVFVGDSLNMDAVIRDRNGVLVPTTVNKLLELEEHVWSPMHGLKGNIDATVQVKMQMPGDRCPKTLVVPLELKTGKKDSNETHRAQTALYTLLLSDRYDVNVACGVLYYLETSKTFRVEGVRHEIRNMIIERNDLACYVHDKLELPPMLKKPYLCKSCYSKSECFSYHKLVDGGDGETSGLDKVFIEMTSHLTPSHADFFRKWDDLLTKEERDTMKFKRELWTMLSTERQAVGRCFANVVIESGTSQENKESSSINRYEYTFVKGKAESGFSFTESQITNGEPIVISDERGHFNLASGYVINVRPKRVVVAVDRRLQNAQRRGVNFDPETNQVFAGLMDPAIDDAHMTGDAVPELPRLYRIDKDEFANGMATARNNLIRIMEKDLFKARELRQLIIDNVAPSFRATVPKYAISESASQQQLNIDQQHAIEKVLCAKDYALVLGMPGTGKTTTIAHIIRALVSQGKSVLLTSYTHTAVDNILLKIKDDKIPVLRVGNLSKVHSQVKEFADLTAVPKTSIEELHSSWHDSKVVATTCLGINHALFNARTFDYCIVDEASQITLPVCLGPIRHAQTFILVGDHFQLPPLVQNKEAQKGGLNVSLFKLLSDAHPASVVNLEHQYRMAEDVQLLSSALVYNGRLRCGTPSVTARTLHIPSLEGGLSAYHHDSAASLTRATSTQSVCSNGSTCFLRHALAPANHCVFLDTDHLKPTTLAQEKVAGPRLTNAAESLLISQLATVLIRSGVPPASIGVITFYRSQLALLKQDMKAHAGSAAAADVEMHTADKYQGRDKEVVFLSCVRSNEEGKVGELLKDWRRVNVAVTRARSKLVIVGSRSTLAKSEVPILTGIVRIMGEKGWIKPVEGPVQGAHLFPVVPTQTQASSSQGRRSTQVKHTAKRSPLRPSNGSAGNVSPAKRVSVPGGAFKKPRRIADGKMARAQMAVEKSAVLKEVLDEELGQGQENLGVDYGGFVESSPLIEDLDAVLDEDVAF